MAQRYRVRNRDGQPTIWDNERKTWASQGFRTMEDANKALRSRRLNDKGQERKERK